MWDLVVIIIFVALIGTFTWFAVSSDDARAAYIEGKRAGLKRAAEIARERGNIAIQVAPEGGLGVGVIRGQMAHAIELEILGAMVEQ